MLPGLSAVRAATIAVLAIALTSCSFGNGPVFLQRYERPRPGEPVPESFWTAASVNAEPADPDSAGDPAQREDQVAFDITFWLLPTWVSARHRSTPPEADSVSDTRAHFFDLGVVCIPFLPLWLSTDTQLVRRSGQRAETGIVWTPLWTATHSAAWPADERRASAGGFPLLYGWVEYGREGEEPAFEMHNVLWTLGPSWLRIDWPESAEPQLGLAADGETHSHGWAFSPLLLAGPGAWVWTSSEIADDELDQTVHGPLSGWLGYRSTLELRPEGAFWIPPGAASPALPTLFTRRVVAGALWYDSEEVVGGVTSEARHGPLWGVFGWGQSSARPVIYLLWFPVEI